MARRRRAQAEDRPELDEQEPEWLFHFDYASWLPGFSPEHPDPDRFGPFTGDLHVWMAANERWHAEAHAWLAKHDLYMDGHRQPDQRVVEWLEFKKAHPHRVIDGRRGMHAANAEKTRERVRTMLPEAGGNHPDRGKGATAAEADFPMYGSGDPEGGS